MEIIAGKNIIIGVTGGIAAYKTLILARLFINNEAILKVVMTKAAESFIGPLSFQAISGSKVGVDILAPVFDSGMDHIELAREADLIIIAPATANTIAKIAHGFSDNLLTSIILASNSPVMICPAMNNNMWANQATIDNINILKKRGMHICGPAYGGLACSDSGAGRMEEPEFIFEDSMRFICENDFSGIRFLISAGPTQEPIDPVRYITNRSSGKMGYELARAARMRGAEVTLVSGSTNLPGPIGVDLIKIRTAEEMSDAIDKNFINCDICIMAAAVGDYRPQNQSEQKIKKDRDVLNINLEKNPDILLGLGKRKGDKFLVGFAAETENLIKNATKKLFEKNLNMIVANDVSRTDAGFQTDTNQVHILTEKSLTKLALMSKLHTAHRILDSIKAMKNER